MAKYGLYGGEEVKRVVGKDKSGNEVEYLPVIRCKDCENYEEKCPAYGYCYHWKYEEGESPNEVYPDDFCSYGVRKEN